MPASLPHILLFSEADSSQRSTGRWHFLLESMQGETLVEASADEPGVHGERLELLAVVRGLEALDQPSRVTLVTSSRQVSRGLRSGLDEWRGNHWQWERDGRRVPIKNHDLWQRIDWALKFHEVQCRSWRLDPSPLAMQPTPRRADESLDASLGPCRPAGGRISAPLVGDARALADLGSGGTVGPVSGVWPHAGGSGGRR